LDVEIFIRDQSDLWNLMDWRDDQEIQIYCLCWCIVSYHSDSRCFITLLMLIESIMVCIQVDWSILFQMNTYIHQVLSLSNSWFFQTPHNHFAIWSNVMMKIMKMMMAVWFHVDERIHTLKNTIYDLHLNLVPSIDVYVLWSFDIFECQVCLILL
jgi:hypothetical protein